MFNNNYNNKIKIFKIKNKNKLLTFKKYNNFNNLTATQNFHLIRIKKYKSYKRNQNNHQIKLEILI
jgi:hypothetical protein